MLLDWPRFIDQTREHPAWPLLQRAEALAGKPGRALDLGCGAGRDTRYLLSHGWHVTAVDSEPRAMTMLAGLPQANLRAVRSTIQNLDYEPEAYDLINAQFSLPFVPRARFDETFSRIKQAIKPGGIFAGQFFGVRDGWNRPENDMTFLTSEEVNDQLAGLEVIELKEEENTGSTATGEVKHWHVFHVIARK